MLLQPSPQRQAPRGLQRDALRADELAEREPGGKHELARPLLAWFAQARRALPWRTDPRDPYTTWLSEVMLQQTRVETMVPYFHRFLARFPTLAALAEAPLDDVLARWSGLGYYARARNLHRAAIAALREHGGLPRTSAALRELPGFGPYTSAAVASLAFGEQVALVDGNVARVLSRALGLAGDVEQAKEKSWAIAPRLLPPRRAGELNEALMELGALVCTPRGPDCPRCPLAEGCVARALGDPEAIPGPKPRKERPLITRVALRVVRPGGQLLLERQPPGALFEGLWDLPWIEAGRPPDQVDHLNQMSSISSLNQMNRLSKIGSVNQIDKIGKNGSVDQVNQFGSFGKSGEMSVLAGLAAALARRLGLAGEKAGRPRRLARVEQTLTHRELRVEIFGLEIGEAAAKRVGLGGEKMPDSSRSTQEPETAPREKMPERKWTRPDAGALAKLGLSSLARKSLKASEEAAAARSSGPDDEAGG